MPKDKSSATSAVPVGEESLEPKAAEKAFEKFKSRMLGLDPNKLAVQSVDMEKAAVAAAAVGRWVCEKEPRARFASLPKKHFDQAHADDLDGVALATWHAAITLRSANAGKSEAKLPVSLVQQATALRARMVLLVDYNFGDNPVDRTEIDDIKVGSGYTDLASDLLRLAKLYAKYKDAVKLDPKNYQAGDDSAAGRVAHAIMRELGEAKNQEQKVWSDLVARSWTLLIGVYDEVAAAGSWLYRHEGAAQRFPSLHSAGRATPKRTKGAKDPKEAPPAEGDGTNKGKGGGKSGGGE